MAAAFNLSTTNNLQSNIRSLHYRRKHINKLELTFEEYIQSFVPSEMRDTFRTITPWVTVNNYSERFELRLPGSTVQAVLMLKDGENTPLIPRHMTIQPDAPIEIIDRIHAWHERGGDVSRDYGRVSKLLSMFNENFSRVAIRYYWPTIIAICSESDYTKDLVKELQELRTPAKLKPLPPGVAKACRQAAETIATARLVPADAGENIKVADVTIDIVSGQHYNEEFGDFYGM